MDKMGGRVVTPAREQSVLPFLDRLELLGLLARNLSVRSKNLGVPMRYSKQQQPSLERSSTARDRSYEPAPSFYGAGACTWLACGHPADYALFPRRTGW